MHSHLAKAFPKPRRQKPVREKRRMPAQRKRLALQDLLLSLSGHDVPRYFRSSHPDRWYRSRALPRMSALERMSLLRASAMPHRRYLGTIIREQVLNSCARVVAATMAADIRVAFEGQECPQ